MEFDLENWLDNTGRVQDTLKAMYEIVEFSKGVYSKFFQNCGLYAVGSSLRQKRPNDVDLVLVGLDFRAVAEYDKIFLQDPETLIAEEIVIPPALARRRGVINPLSFMVSPNRLKSAWHPLPEAPGTKERQNPVWKKRLLNDGSSALEAEVVQQDRLEDLDSVHQFMLEGIEYKGEYWAYNFQKGMAGSTALSLNNYCLRRGTISQLVEDFHRDIASAFGQDQHSWNLVTPFEPYFHQEESFLTCRFNIHEDRCSAKKEFTDDRCACRPIDLIIHAENLHARYWKQHQKGLNYHYACLHEWPKVEEITERPILTNLPYPEFIDPDGRGRVKPHRYFLEFLRTTPINT